jgi:glycosyltransferase involved in cell wall biosynthesis
MMVQNIEPLQKAIYPMPLMWRLRLLALRREHRLACRQATRVLAVSNHTKAELCRRFGLSADTVDVVHHGVDFDEGPACRPSLEIPGDFLFAAGSIVPYRGYEDCIRAIARLREWNGDTPALVLAGTGATLAEPYERMLRALAKALHVEDRVIWAGQLSRDRMNWCYRNARLFIQSSRAEACPNIQLEAIGNGCLCVSCDHPPMPEISQDAAFYYRVGDDMALAQRIRETLNLDPDEAAAARARARHRAAELSWDATAQRTLDVLCRAVRDHSANPVRSRA